MMADRQVEIYYTNHRGERRKRIIVPRTILFENSAWHPGTQWILHAIDIERGEGREFAMKNIHSWRPL